MLSKIRIYLAGPVTGLVWHEIMAYRDKAVGLLGPEFEILNPVRGQGKYVIGAPSTPDAPDNLAKTVTRQCLWDVRRADLVMVDLRETREVSLGTCLEIGFASASHVPIIAFGEKNGRYGSHPMISEMVDYRFDTLEESCAWARCLTNLNPHTAVIKSNA